MADILIFHMCVSQSSPLVQLTYQLWAPHRSFRLFQATGVTKALGLLAHLCQCLVLLVKPVHPCWGLPNTLLHIFKTKFQQKKFFCVNPTQGHHTKVPWKMKLNVSLLPVRLHFVMCQRHKSANKSFLLSLDKWFRKCSTHRGELVYACYQNTQEANTEGLPCI